MNVTEILETMLPKSLLPLLTALLIAPAVVPLLPATVCAQTTTGTNAAALLEEADRLSMFPPFGYCRSLRR
jgi:hypothetical protein